VSPMPSPRRDNGHPPTPTHWRDSVDSRPDVMPATSGVERREEERAAHVMRDGGS
jgi:hypothetical protein